jgi:hypothetical protein
MKEARRVSQAQQHRAKLTTAEKRVRLLQQLKSLVELPIV